jgi:hypothetical protein
MHVAITVTAPASEAYAKAAHAIGCLKRQVVSDNKELLSLPWIVRVIQSGDGPPQAYLNQGPPGPPMGHPGPRRPPQAVSPMERRPRQHPPSGYPPSQDGYPAASRYTDYAAPPDDSVS